MSSNPYRACRVGGRRTHRTERQNPYYRSRNSPLQTESCSRQLINDSRRQSALNEDVLYPSPNQERSRSNRRHSDRYFGARGTRLNSPLRSSLRNCYLPNSHKDSQSWRADTLQDLSGQRSAEMAYSKGHRVQPTRSKAQGQRFDQQYLGFDQQQTRSEMAPLISRKWGSMVELEELTSEQQNSDFETEYIGLCPEQMREGFEDVPVQRSTSTHVRQNSMMSNPSSFGSDSTTESKKIRMSATPRFTESELNTQEVQAIIARRKKQIHYGKVLDCYHQYNQVVPRRKRTKYHPQTPDIYRSYSRRGFDTLVRTWKKQLHVWEPAEGLGRSVKLGSTCESSIATDASDVIQNCKTEIKEDMDDYDYDLEFPPNPPSAAVSTEGSSELHSVGSAVTMKAESSDYDTPACGVVVKTEKPDDFFFDETCY